MPSHYELRFNELRKNNCKAFIPFTILGWPNKEKSLALIKQMIKSGASALELGIAFSDPIADGPILQAAAFETISSGFTVNDAFALLSEVRRLDADIPIGLLVYFNTVMAKGIENFFALAKTAGVDGVLIADLPAESADEVVPAANNAGVDLIFLISPVTPADKLTKIISQASGFLYFVSRLGVTGTDPRSRSKDLTLKNCIEEIKLRTQLPVCAGFGIATTNDAESMFENGADGIIIGSQVIKIAQTDSLQKASEHLEQYYADMIATCQKRSIKQCTNV
jgi:tryptophan synthase alpha chain